MQRNEVKWRCRRGLLELDIWLQHFFDQYYDQLAPSEQLLFQQLIHEEDPTLWDWFVGNSPIPSAELAALTHRIKSSFPRK
jgi:antitoxin CptB